MRLIPRDQSFFALYDGQAATGADAARLLEAELRDLSDTVALSTALQGLEHHGDDINHEISHKLESTFVTPYEREDMQALAMALDDVIDLIEKVGDMLVLFHVTEVPPGAADQAAVLVQACDVLVEATAALRQRGSARAYRSKVHDIEQAGDVMVRRLIGGLFDDPGDVKALIIANDVYEGIEEALDAADRAGRIVGQMR